jgi:hypothetical protein
MKLAVVPQGVFAFSLETDCRCIDEFIDKAKQNIDTAIFTINMTEKPLTEVADFLEMFVLQVKVPESVRTGQ